MTRGLRSLACVAGLTEIDHIFAYIWPIKLSLEEIEGFEGAADEIDINAFEEAFLINRAERIIARELEE